MKKTNNIFFILLFFFIAVTSCQSLKDGLTGTKKQNSDEFLIEKKNPLVLPPNYDKLPTPMDKKNIEDNDDVDFSSSLDKIKKSTTDSNSELETSSLEEKILKKIK